MPLSPAAVLLLLGAAAPEPLSLHSVAMASGSTVPAPESGDPRPAPSGPCPKTITVGYQMDIPFGDDTPHSRARTLIDETFARSGLAVAFKRYPREGVAAGIVSGSVQLGVVAVAGVVSESTMDGSAVRHGKGLSSDQLIPTTNVRGVQALPIQHSGYSVVTRARQPDRVEAFLEHFEQGQLARWVWLAPGAVFGVFMLALSALALNLRRPTLTRAGNSTGAGPTQGKLIVGSINRVDAQLTAPRTAHWLLRTRGGRLFGIVWAAFGGWVAVLAIPGAAPGHHEPLSDDAIKLKGATEAAYPGSKILEYRHGKWRKCDRPFDCLEDYQKGHVAALAGDHDVLCQYAERFGAIRLVFDNGIAVPVLYALLLPEPANGEDEPCRQEIREALALALRRPLATKSPWESCGD